MIVQAQSLANRFNCRNASFAFYADRRSNHEPLGSDAQGKSGMLRIVENSPPHRK
jgi:hypothetical protein